MGSFSLVLGSVAPVFALIALGYLCGRRQLLGQNAFEVLNRFVLRFALPVLTFHILASIHPADLAQPAMIVAIVGGAAIVYCISFAIDLLGRRPASDANIIAMVASYANAAFIGLPICLLVLGSKSLAPAALMVALNASLIFGFPLAVGELLTVRDSTPLGALGHAARALALNPLIQSSAAGIAWSLTGLPLPGPVDTFATTLGGATGACALIAIGLFIAQPRPRAAPTMIARVLLLKLAVQPLATWLLFLLMPPVPPVWARTAILLAAMPTGTGSFMLAATIGPSALNTSARAIILSTLTAVATLSMAILLISGTS